MTDERSTVPVISRIRLEFLVDGVFAIALTILVPEAAYLRSRQRWLRGCLVITSLFALYLIRLLVN